MDTDDLLRQRLGDFTILSVLGQGAMARVYRAWQESEKRDVALKVIRRIPGDAEDSVARFERERTVLQKLEHPNIMPIYDFSANADYLWIASPLVQGGTLEDQLKSGPMPVQVVGEILRQLAGAVDLADARGVVHRDIKPSNVMIDRRVDNDHYYLADFGVAKLLEAEGLTAPGVTVGTPSYMSPEQVQGKPLTARSDQYALGIMVYQLLTGALPFTGKLVEIMQAQARSAPPPLPPGFPASLENVLLRALSKDPAGRFGSCTVFAQAFSDAATARPGSVPFRAPIVEELPIGATVAVAAIRIDEEPPSAPPALAPTSPSSSKNRMIAGGAAAFIALIAFGYGVGSLFKHRSSPNALAYCVHKGAGDEIWLRGADGAIRSLGSGRAARNWPGGSAILALDSDRHPVKLDRVDGKREVVARGAIGGQAAAVSPDGKWLIGQQGAGALSRIELGEGASRKLPAGPGRCDWPAIAPHGDLLAYSSEADGVHAIYLLDLKSKKKRRLTHPESPDGDICPAWSPDGQRLVFEREHDGTRHLRFVDLKGKEEEAAVTGSGGQPSWAPSSEIAYVNEQGIFAFVPGKGKPEKLVEAGEAGSELQSPSWLGP